jgi:hypothetical protein
MPIVAVRHSPMLLLLFLFADLGEKRDVLNVRNMLVRITDYII